MRTSLLSSFFLACNILYVFCAPLPLKVDIPGVKGKHLAADVDRIHEATALANAQITAMHNVVENSHLKANKKILVHTFGKHYDLGAVKHHVEQLRTQTVRVGQVNDKEMATGTLAKTSEGGKADASIRFGPMYHSSKTTPENRAGTLIHEASHALWGTKDYFRMDNKAPLGKKETKALLKQHKKGDPPNVLTGYMNQYRYKKLRDDPQSKMHMNADSWKAFGHHALTGKPHPDLSEFKYHPKAESSKLSARIRAKSAHTKPLFPPPSRSRSRQGGRSKSVPPRRSPNRNSNTPRRGRSPQRRH